MGPKYIGVMT